MGFLLLDMPMCPDPHCILVGRCVGRGGTSGPGPGGAAAISQCLYQDWYQEENSMYPLPSYTWRNTLPCLIPKTSTTSPCTICTWRMRPGGRCRQGWGSGKFGGGLVHAVISWQEESTLYHGVFLERPQWNRHVNNSDGWYEGGGYWCRKYLRK